MFGDEDDVEFFAACPVAAAVTAFTAPQSSLNEDEPQSSLNEEEDTRPPLAAGQRGADGECGRFALAGDALVDVDDAFPPPPPPPPARPLPPLMAPGKIIGVFEDDASVARESQY